MARPGRGRRKGRLCQGRGSPPQEPIRSEEHTSELQSRLHLVCRLLLEKKKKNKHCVSQRQSLCYTSGSLDVKTDSRALEHARSSDASMATYTSSSVSDALVWLITTDRA